MTDKITLTQIANLQNENTAVNAINTNSDVIELAFNNTLSRDGTAPNQMEAPLDMNSNQIINLPNPTTANSPLRLQDLETFNGGGTISSIPAGGTTGQVLEKTSNVDFQTSWGFPPSGRVRGTLTSSTAFAGSWNVSNADGSTVNTSSTTTGGLQEFLNTVSPSDPNSSEAFEGDWAGGQETFASGGGARIIEPAVSVTVPAGSGKKIRMGSTSLFSIPPITTPSLIFDSQIMADIRLDGWQIFNFGTTPGPAVSFAPNTTILTGANQMLNSRFSITTCGPVLMNSTGNGGFSVSEYNIMELNASANRSQTVTITIAAPGIFAWASHGLAAGTPVVLTTTGALPTGLVAGTQYFVSSGATLLTNSFAVSDTLAHAVSGTNQIATTGTQSGVHTATAQQQSPYGWSTPTPAGNVPAQFNWVNINDIHDIGAGKDAFQWGTSAPGSSPMFGNMFKLGISTGNGAANGIHTWASNNLYIASIGGVTTGKSILLESGAADNIFILPYNSASNTITDNSGALGNAANGNIIIGGGRMTIGGGLVPTFISSIPAAGHLTVIDSSGASLGDGGVLGTLANLNAAPAGTLTGTALNATVVTSSLTTVGTIGTGTWQGTVVGPTYGGTGVNNASKTISLGGNVSTANSLTTSGNFALTLTTTNTTNSTLPAGTHTLAGLDVAQTWGATQSFNIIQPSADASFNLGSPANRWNNAYFVNCFTAGAFQIAVGAALVAGGSQLYGFTATTTPNFGIYFGSGAPTMSAAQGSLYLRSDGSSTLTRLYVNTNGTTGWTNFTSTT